MPHQKYIYMYCWAKMNNQIPSRQLGSPSGADYNLNDN